MIAARKNRIANALIYRLLVLGPAKRHFHTVCLRHMELPPAADDQPCILFANHSAWWDAYMIMLVNERIWRLDSYVMMEDTQLARYRFFRYAGAFSVDRHNPRSAADSIHYVVGELQDRPGRCLLMFPQGELQANDVRPLGFYAGIGHIIKRAGRCRAYPVALRYEFVGEQQPEAFVSVGQPQEFGATDEKPKDIAKRMELALTAELDRLRDDVVARRFGSFTILVNGAWSVNRLWDMLRGRSQIKQLGPQDDVRQ